ncbi:MAG TPA: hypothetical protein VK705_12015 [Ferruginibacter sp.]|jgi:hypothetical protein|nr:hypothetical protein [Ferruginibacter sp.]
MDEESKNEFLGKIEEIIKVVVPLEEIEFIELLKNGFLPIIEADFDNPNHSDIETKVKSIEAFVSIPKKYPQYDNSKYTDYLLKFQRLFIASFLNNNKINEEIKKDIIKNMNAKDMEYIYPELKESKVHKENIDYVNSFESKLEEKESVHESPIIMQKSELNKSNPPLSTVINHTYNNSNVTYGDNSPISVNQDDKEMKKITKNGRNWAIVGILVAIALAVLAAHHWI